MSKIYGLPITTPFNPEKLKRKELPVVSASDNGKILAVIGGEWKPYKVEIPEEVPVPTTADNGKILQVVNGDYSLVSKSSVATAVDLSSFDSNGTIVETFADGSSKTTTVEFDASGNPVKITDGNGNVTTLTW